MKARGNIVKALLREAGRGLLPDEILFRRKSPYPKTYDRKYEALLAGRVRDILNDSSSLCLALWTKRKQNAFWKARRITVSHGMASLWQRPSLWPT